MSTAPQDLCVHDPLLLGSFLVLMLRLYTLLTLHTSAPDPTPVSAPDPVSVSAPDPVSVSAPDSVSVSAPDSVSVSVLIL